MEGPFNDPEIPHGERTVYRALVAGEEAGTGEVVIERETDGGRHLYRQSISARLRDAAQWSAETTFRRRAGTMHVEAHRMQTFNGKADPICSEEARFRDVRTLQWGAQIEPYPRDVTPLLGCAIALRGLEFEPGARRGFAVWLANSIHWAVESHVEKQERLALPAGELSGWRVRLRPSFEQVDRALDRVIDALMPPLVAHLEIAAPHRLLRLEFPTGPFKWNPPGTIEAVEL